MKDYRFELPASFPGSRARTLLLQASTYAVPLSYENDGFIPVAKISAEGMALCQLANIYRRLGRI